MRFERRELQKIYKETFLLVSLNVLCVYIFFIKCKFFQKLRHEMPYKAEN